MQWFGRTIHKIGRVADKLTPGWMIPVYGGFTVFGLFFSVPLAVESGLLVGVVAFIVAAGSAATVLSALQYDKTRSEISLAVVARELRQVLAKMYASPRNERDITWAFMGSWDLRQVIEGRYSRGIHNDISPVAAEKLLRALGIKDITASDMQEEINYLLHLPSTSLRTASEILANHPPVLPSKEQKELDMRKDQERKRIEREKEYKQKKINAAPQYIDKVNQQYDTLVENWMRATESSSSAFSDLRNPKLLAFCVKMEEIQAIRQDPLRIAEFRHSVKEAEELWRELNASRPVLSRGYARR